MPEGELHLELKILLFALLKARLRGRMFVGCDQFVYWAPAEPSSCLAPDVFVKRGEPPPRSVRSYKIWERGVPDVGVEIIDRNGSRWTSIEDKLERYRLAGIGEIVFFDSDGEEPLLRIWDWVAGDVVERDLGRHEARRCRTLEAYWVIVNDAELGPTLRLAEDADGHALWPTPAESERAQKEAERAQKEAERAQKEAERAQKEAERAQKEAERTQKEAERAQKEAERAEKERALARVAELEAELARRR